ncbi:hypothetical protein B8V81_3554 [Paenibacillus pasadenensis]|uniref:Uncharacterized protein n=1 Tax=Paenibacillus pasadenensis TaxID=217090 RepID=A0A2N5N464_9BACL|nr:hypothetical protein B8V81_3554 [Paenibacillus pasadenensis]
MTNMNKNPSLYIAFFVYRKDRFPFRMAIETRHIKKKQPCSA